jgi:dihydroorotate dehydrogenase electron transfer subunit
LKQAKAYVVSNKRILPGGPHRAGRVLASHLMHLHCPEIAHEAKPGQFVMVRCGDLILPRPFSIHQAIKDNIALFFAVLEGGKGTNWLAERKDGDAIELPMLRPLGNGFSISPRAKNLLLVAGGMGLAPLCFLAQQAVREKRSVTLLLGAASGPLYTERPENLLPSRITLATATEDGSIGKKGRVTDLLPDFVGWADQIFACGPMPMYRDMALKKQELKLEGKPIQVSLEVRMGCGLGVCYGCTVKTKNGLTQVCKDGPVFNLEDILWDELNCW